MPTPVISPAPVEEIHADGDSCSIYEWQDSGPALLIILTPRLRPLIAELHQTPDPQARPALYRKYESELLA